VAEEANTFSTSDNRTYSNERSGEDKYGGVERARIGDRGS